MIFLDTLYTSVYCCTVNDKTSMIETVEVRIRHLTDDLHRALKIRAAQEATTLNELILHALEVYAQTPFREGNKRKR